MKKKTLYWQVRDGNLTEEEFDQIRLHIKQRTYDRIRSEEAGRFKEMLRHLEICIECREKIVESLGRERNEKHNGRSDDRGN